MNGFVHLGTVLLSLGLALPSIAIAAPAERPVDLSWKTPLETRALDCRGNEPFWALSITPSLALVRRLVAAGIEDQRFPGRLTDLSFLDPMWTVFRGGDADAPDAILVVVTRVEACLDTMSDDPPFERRAVVTFADGTVATGCCAAAMGLSMTDAPSASFAGKPEHDWTRLWPDLRAGIDRCLVGTDEPVEAVTTAWPMNHGLIGVRLRLDDGTRRTCIVEQTGASVRAVAPVSDDALLPGEGQPDYLPAREPPPILTCGAVERINDDTDGTLVGYLHYGGPCAAQH